MSPELRYRLSIQEKQRLAKATSMLKQGKKMEEIVSKLLPWQTETGVGSTELVEGFLRFALQFCLRKKLPRRGQYEFLDQNLT